MTLNYSYRRPATQNPIVRYSTQQRQAAREAARTGAAATLTPGAVGAMQYGDDKGAIRVVTDVLFELESNRLQRPTAVRLLRNGSQVQPAQGTVDLLVDGRRRGLGPGASAIGGSVTFPEGSSAATAPTVELRWDDARRVNVIEVPPFLLSDSDLPQPGTVQQIRVWTLDQAGNRTLIGDSPAVTTGDLSYQIAPYAAPISCYGVAVQLLAFSGSIATLSEVDPMLIVDVSTQVERLDLEYSRETDPATTPNPVGSYEASNMTITLDNTAGQWNPATNPALDVGHRVEIALGVQVANFTNGNPNGTYTTELLPAGVFFTDPFDTDSESTTVTLTGADRLGRNSELEVSEGVFVNQTLGTIIRTVAIKYLEVPGISIPASIASTVIPYAYPSGQLGSFLADLAKAAGATINIDPTDTVVIARRVDTSEATPHEVRADTALVSFRRPAGYDVTKSVVTLTASPLALDSTVTELWAMPSGGITIPQGGAYELIAEYSTAPALNVAYAGVVADGSYTVESAVYYSDRAKIVIRNNESRALVVADLRVRGNALVERPLTARREHLPSVRRYGPRELAVEARLIQTQGQLDVVAEVLLDAYRSLADDGTRRLPDLTLSALGLFHLTTGDRVHVQHDRFGVDMVATIIARKLGYQDGALLLSETRVRQVPAELRFTVTDSGHFTDDGRLVSY